MKIATLLKFVISQVNSTQRKKIYFYAFINSLMSLLDLFMVLLLILAITKVTDPTSKNSVFADILNINFFVKMNTENTIYLLLSIYVIRLVIYLYINKNYVNLLSEIQYDFSRKLLDVLSKMKQSRISQLNPHSMNNSINIGMTALTTNLLTQVSIIYSDLLVVLLISMAIAYKSPLLILAILVYGIIFMIILLKLIAKRITYFNKKMMESRLSSSARLFEFLNIIPELHQDKFRDYFASRSQGALKDSAKWFGKDLWTQQLPKLFLESIVYIGILLTGLISYKTNMVNSQSLMILAISGLRILPGFLRIQGAIFSIRSSLPMAYVSYEAMSQESDSPSDMTILTSRKHFKAVDYLSLKNVSVKDNKDEFILNDINLKFSKGEKVCIVGPSGSGKSTLLKLISGNLDRTSGEIEYFGIPQSVWLEKFSSQIAYLPQNPNLFEGTLHENVALSELNENFSIDEIDIAIGKAGINKDTRDRLLNRGNLFTNIDNVSGGEKQRIGIARVIFRRPKLVLLDESTSQLDIKSEQMVLETLFDMDGDTVLIAVAHRISTINRFSRIICIENGKVSFDGTPEKIYDMSKDW